MEFAGCKKRKSEQTETSIAKKCRSEVERIDLNPSAIQTFLIRGCFDKPSADVLYAALIAHPDWRIREFKIFGKTIPEPRKTAFWARPLGREILNYHYSGRDHVGGTCPEIVETAFATVESRLKSAGLIAEDFRFNFVLANLYRSGEDYIGLHSDDERDLTGPIASLSLGQTRTFAFLPRKVAPRLVKRFGSGKPEGPRVSFRVCHGDLLLMDSLSQVYYKHTVPKEKAAKSPRVNLTFRRIQASA
eukprot:Protomagalhaensia_wolfi_Nauph_80__2139@NODE_2375_length_1111_cov_18_265858_g1861_i0_p1_GENE_NODE_2375_length_1111_cov_18_265858_g1861_i0NODE_2375_length_1111_cov_18_265858_g1861_i0_p1_ORF_typecomplete_len246_score34_032OGFeII_Oxy_2/PF13532_6/3_6e30_NODE_2375_length_1111_cov_18_265858_g1861_i0236973